MILFTHIAIEFNGQACASHALMTTRYKEINRITLKANVRWIGYYTKIQFVNNFTFQASAVYN